MDEIVIAKNAIKIHIIRLIIGIAFITFGTYIIVSLIKETLNSLIVGGILLLIGIFFLTLSIYGLSRPSVLIKIVNRKLIIYKKGEYDIKDIKSVLEFSSSMSKSLLFSSKDTYGDMFIKFNNSTHIIVKNISNIKSSVAKLIEYLGL